MSNKNKNKSHTVRNESKEEDLILIDQLNKQVEELSKALKAANPAKGKAPSSLDGVLTHLKEEIKKPTAKYVTIEPMQAAIALAIETGKATVEQMKSKRQIMYMARVRRAIQLFQQASQSLNI